MKNKKLLIFFVLAIFCAGMVMGTASASHTIKAGKYKITISDKEYKKIKKTNKKNGWYYVEKNTGKYKKVKVPTYKTKKVTKKKWVYKNVVLLKTISYDSGNIVEYDNTNLHEKYIKKGWKSLGKTNTTKTTKNKDGKVLKVIEKFKKKVKYSEKKKVKAGYKTKKIPIIMSVGANYRWGIGECKYVFYEYPEYKFNYIVDKERITL